MILVLAGNRTLRQPLSTNYVDVYYRRDCKIHKFMKIMIGVKLRSQVIVRVFLSSDNLVYVVNTSVACQSIRLGCNFECLCRIVQSYFILKNSQGSQAQHSMKPAVSHFRQFPTHMMPTSTHALNTLSPEAVCWPLHMPLAGREEGSFAQVSSIIH
jgi:hypothetical protein